jgi:hypothetical protein
VGRWTKDKEKVEGKMWMDELRIAALGETSLWSAKLTRYVVQALITCNCNSRSSQRFSRAETRDKLNIVVSKNKA